MNFEEFKNLTELGVGLAVASRNAEMRPDLADLVGITLGQDGKTLVAFINSQESKTALSNFKSFPEIAISMARPCDNFAAQVKGRVTQIRTMTTEWLF